MICHLDVVSTQSLYLEHYGLADLWRRLAAGRIGRLRLDVTQVGKADRTDQLEMLAQTILKLVSPLRNVNAADVKSV